MSGDVVEVTGLTLATRLSCGVAYGGLPGFRNVEFRGGCGGTPGVDRALDGGGGIFGGELDTTADTLVYLLPGQGNVLHPKISSLLTGSTS